MFSGGVIYDTTYFGILISEGFIFTTLAFNTYVVFQQYPANSALLRAPRYLKPHPLAELAK